MSLNRAGVYGDEALWIRVAYREIFANQSITAVIRLSDRSDPCHKNHIRAGVPLPVRFIKGRGVAEVGSIGNLEPDDGTSIERTGCIVKKICDLTEEDLRGTAPDTATPELVRYHLATINDTELPSWDTAVTIWRFKHLPKVTE